MKSRTAALMIACAMGLAGCSPHAQTFTLYRTSSMDAALRVHWGTFDARESDPDYNRNNCEMAARLLTANMRALIGAEYDPRQGFWCEAGGYSRKGDVPASFDAKFPTDA